MSAAHETPEHKRLGRVIREYQAEFSDPLTVRAGERLEVSGKVDTWRGNPAWLWVWCIDPRGKGGWVPPNLIETQGESAAARYDYSAVELSAQVGEILSIERAENGGLWCANQRGQRGWIPADHVQPLGAGG